MIQRYLNWFNNLKFKYKMDEYATMSCSKCASCPDDILILTCDHNLCLVCACKNLQRERLKSSTEVRSVTCDICGTSTILDPESAAELLQVYVEEDPPEETYSTHSYVRQNTAVRMCPEHDEPIQYFCLSCECACICAECVIHG